MADLSKLLVSIVAGVMCAGTVQSAPIDPVDTRVVVIRDKFIAAMRRCGATPTFVPTFKSGTGMDISSYHFDDRAVHIRRWADLPPPIKDMMTAWAAAGTMGLTPEQMFREVFNDLLIAHELGHYMEHMSGRMLTLDPTDFETEANRIAFAFWSIDPKDRAALPKRYENMSKFLLALPDPVPADRDPRDYLAKNYARIGQDGQAYGWYQGRFMQDAWAKRGERDFCGWVRANPPLPDVQIKR